MVATGAVTLDGTLDLSTVGGFTPTVGQTFTILSGSAVTGSFATVTGAPISGTLSYAVSYTATGVVLTVVDSAPAGHAAGHLAATSR